MRLTRVLPRECTGHSKHPFPTTQETTLHMDITRWSVPKSDWLYSLRPKMEKLYTVSKNKTGSWLWLRSSDLELLCICIVCVLSSVWLFVTLWTVAHQVPLSMGFFRQEWVAIYSSRGFSQPGDWTCVSCTMSLTCVHSSSGTLLIRSRPLNLFLTSTV